MNCLFGWMPRRGAADDGVIAGLRDAVVDDSRCRAAWWHRPGLAIGSSDLTERLAEPVVSADGRYRLWAAGEIYAGIPSAPGSLQDESSSRAVLEHLLSQGIEGLGTLDGEFQIALWDEFERALTIAGDRFGCLPLYWCFSSDGFVFAGRVSAVLGAPGVSADPDPDALREMVTFGGYRLGDRTNVRSVRMLRGGHALTVRDHQAVQRRYRQWPPAPAPATRPLDELVDEAHALWVSAVKRRLHGAVRPGNTLSGGLDSRAILAEGCAQGGRWSSLTYGIPGCDDARIAEAAAARAGAEWHFHPLYHDRDGGWLDRRTAQIARTDGLVQLVDLMHLERFDLQASLMDVHVCGYIGDAVCGPTFGLVGDAAGVLAKMPYSGIALGWGHAEALAWAEQAVREAAPGAARYALFDHKLPQSIHRIFQAAQGHVRVRRPFLDHALFDFFAALEGATRGRVYHSMLRRHYPGLFARLPHQATNAPVLTAPRVVQARRVARYAWRRARNAAAGLGLGTPAPSRAYHDEERYWRQPHIAARLAGTILRPGSIAAEIFGRAPLTAFVQQWFAGGPGPAQAIGALFVYENYQMRNLRIYESTDLRIGIG